MPDPQPRVGGPSEKAVQGGASEEAAGLAFTASFDPGNFLPRGDNYEEPIHRWQARAVVKVMHDPALGLDRSVCLRDVVEALRRQACVSSNYAMAFGFDPAADFLAREFTVQSSTDEGSTER